MRHTIASITALILMVGSAFAQAPLPPVPPAMGVPKPGPVTDAPYQPQPIMPGGIVMTLWPAGSPYLNAKRVREAEVYNMDTVVPGRVNSMVNIHNPSIEVHLVDGRFDTGAAVILAGGGGHRTLNVGSEAADIAHFLYNYGVNAIILRNRLKSDGYDPKTDEVYDAQQAIRLVRAHAAKWHIDPAKIGIMGFSAGAELAAATALKYPDFDAKNKTPADPLAGISSRPDFVGLIYPGPSLFTKGGTPAIPKDTPPAFILCAGWGDRVHAIWADEYFAAMIKAGIPNVEMHIYARGHHPGDPVGPDDPPSSGGLTYRAFTAFGSWGTRFVDWFHDLGFLNKPGVQTLAAKDVAAYVTAPPPK